MRTAPIKAKGQKPIHPIDGKETFHHLVLDLIDFNASPAGPDAEFHYVAHLVDHFSTFHYTEAIRNKSAVEALHFVRKIISIIGFPHTLHTDNGGEFDNRLLDSYCRQHNINFVHGKPYTPSTQGKVERGNRTLQEIINKLVAESRFKKTWFDVLYEATFCMNTNLSTAIRKSPYEQVYCMHPRNEGNLLSYRPAIQDLIKSINNKGIASSNENENQEPNSPNLLDIDVAYGKEDNIEAIRGHSKVSYYTNLERMKFTHDRLRNINTFAVGDVVGVIIPSQYVQSEANKLPAVVIKVDDVASGNPAYALAFDQYIIESKYFQHEILPLVGENHYYGLIVSSSETEYITVMMLRPIKRFTRKLPD
jgi:transposase InsO family protein